MIYRSVYLTGLGLYKTASSFTSIESEYGKKYFSLNYDSEEPGMKYFFTNYDIDEVVIVGTKETIFDSDCRRIDDFLQYAEENFKGELVLDDGKWKCDGKIISSYEFFLRRIYAFISGNNNIQDDLGSAEPEYYEENKYENEYQKKEHNNIFSVVFVEEEKDGEINYRELLDELRGTQETVNCIYMDAQGGRRTTVFLRNTVLHLLSKFPKVYHMQIKQVIAADWRPGLEIVPEGNRIPVNEFDNKLIDVSKEYSVSELYSGVSSFLNYGKVKDLERYCNNNDEDYIGYLTELMNKIDISMSMNCINNFEDDLRNIETELKKTELSEDKLFSIISESIKAEFEPFFRKHTNKLPELLEWCIKKELYYTALCLVEAKSGEFITENGLIYANYDEFFLPYMRFYRNSKDFPKYQYYNIKNFFIRHYILDIEDASHNDKNEEDQHYYERISKSINSKRGIKYSVRPDSGELINSFYKHLLTLVEIRNKFSHFDDSKKTKKKNLINLPDDPRERARIIKNEIDSYIKFLKGIRENGSGNQEDNIFLDKQKCEINNSFRLTFSDVQRLVRHELEHCNFYGKIRGTEFDRLPRNISHTGSMLLTPIANEYRQYKSIIENKSDLSEDDLRKFVNHCKMLTNLVIEGYVDSEGRRKIQYNGAPLELDANGLIAKIKNKNEDHSRINNAISLLNDNIDVLPHADEVIKGLEEMKSRISDDSCQETFNTVRSIAEVLREGKETFDNIISSFLYDKEKTYRLYEILYDKKAEDLKKGEENHKHKNKKHQQYNRKY